VDAHATVENPRQRCGGAGGLRGCCGALLHVTAPARYSAQVGFGWALGRSGAGWAAI